MNEVQTFLHSYHISPLVYTFINGEEKVSWIPENEGKRRYLIIAKAITTCARLPVPKSFTRAVCSILLVLVNGKNCSKLVSFGDAVNDIPMFEVSDEAYAVENAVEELKAYATDVIGSNEDDGVAQ